MSLLKKINLSELREGLDPYLLSAIIKLNKEIDRANSLMIFKPEGESEFAGLKVDEESMAIHKRAIELQTADNGLSYEAAVRKAYAEV